MDGFSRIAGIDLEAGRFGLSKLARVGRLELAR